MDSRESGVHGKGWKEREKKGNDINMLLICQILKTINIKVAKINETFFPVTILYSIGSLMSALNIS